MPGQDTNSPHIIGLAGSFGSGCSYIAKHILKDGQGYNFLSLSEDVLKPLFNEVTGKDPDRSPRRELQEFGDQIRKEKGHGYFAEEIKKRISKEGQAKNADRKWVVDSIRNPAEIRAFRQFSQNFFLFGVYAEKEIRWDRTKVKCQNNRQKFDDDDENDTGEDNPSHGQRVGDCFYEADIVFRNNDNYETIGNEEFKKFAGRISQYVDLISQPLQRQRPIRQEEALMAMAYAVSQRSSCLKRKVGALIVDPSGNVISSGFNEVPASEKPCEKRYKGCYRDWVCTEFFDKLKIEVPEIGNKETGLKVLFRKRFKILDYCKALHAEENAIVNLARYGSSAPLDKCTLYCTTYPCRMCANRIVQLGIKNIIYLEPYPDPEAKLILERGGVDSIFFEGVTFKAYFRLYGEEK
jgi:deoxycytidylate deaminase/dephospho-CoA kinase